MSDVYLVLYSAIVGCFSVAVVLLCGQGILLVLCAFPSPSPPLPPPHHPFLSYPQKRKGGGGVREGRGLGVGVERTLPPPFCAPPPTLGGRLRAPQGGDLITAGDGERD